MKIGIPLSIRLLFAGVLALGLFAAARPSVAASTAGRASDDTLPSGLVTETAKSAFDFVNSIGVNVHLNYFDRKYGDFAFVEKELQTIGIRHLRDGVHLQNADYNNALYSRWVALGKDGIRFDAVLDSRSQLGAITPQLLDKVNNLSGHTIESFEGPNEMDISGLPDWASADRDFQKTIYSALKELPDVNQIAMIAPSFAIAADGSVLAGQLQADEGNLHPYPAGKMPSAIFPEQTALARSIFGNKPIVFTESGYHNGLNDHSDQPGVSERAAAKYMTRLFLEDFSRNIPRTYVYEFLDEAPDPSLKDHQMHWGLIRADGSEKPAFTALQHLIAELQDHAEPAHPDSLAWSLTSAGPSLHHLLLQQSDGNFDLVLWREVPSYDTSRQIDLDPPAEATTLLLGHKARNVTLYEPVVQGDPLKVYRDATRVPLEVPDHPLVIAIGVR